MNSLRSSVLRRVEPFARRFRSHTRTEREARASRLRFYAQFVSPGSLCFDIGANFGNRTEVFLDLGARVVAVDPLPQCASYLRSRFSSLDCTVVEVGLAEAEGERTIRQASVSTIATMSDDFIEGTRESGRFENFDWQKADVVSVTTFDRLVERFGTPDFTKIDVEGFEPMVLAGLSSPIAALSFEYARELDSAERCARRLSELGRYRYAFSPEESMCFDGPQWVEFEKLHDWLAQQPDALLWGDIYARRHD